MNFDVITLASSGKKRIKFGVDDEDINIIQGLIKSALIYTPRTLESEPTITRLREMQRSIKSYKLTT